MGVERGKKMLQNATVSFTFPFAIRMYLSISLWDLELRAFQSARRKLVVIVTRLHVKNRTLTYMRGTRARLRCIKEKASDTASFCNSSKA